MTEARRRWILLSGTLVVSTVVVVAAFNPVPHTGGDNAGYLSLANGLLTERTYTDAFDPEGLAHTKYPPVFPMILALLMSVGARTWVAFKATAAVATVAAVGFTFLWAERRIGPFPAFGVAVLLALSPAVVYYSHWILSDPVFLAFTLAALFTLERATDEVAPSGWLAVGVAAAGLAFFTRSAGLPLVVAIGAWLALGKRWRPLAVTAAAIGLPALAWWWRGRGVGVASYGTEFWLIDPYQPGLGTVGVVGLVPRAFANLSAYVLSHGPVGIVGSGVPAVGFLGVVLTLAAIGGWIVVARERIGPAELFFPLYSGLILLWPEVWAGDRFVLPLYPLVFVYGAVALRAVGRRLPSLAASLVTAVIVLVLFLPASRDWIDQAGQASTCARIARAGGAFACYSPQIGVFAEAAAWTGRALPEGAVVMSRKPRHFFLLSGIPSRTFPFEDDPSAHLALADDLGARYILLDQWDGLANRYVGGAVRRQPGAFCFVRGFGQISTGGAQLLGIRPPGERNAAPVAGNGGVQLEPCPAGYVRSPDVSAYSSSSPSASGRIPLLDGLDS
jgi:hypothetical protein